MAEQTAWDMAKKEGFDLVVINPTLVIGPILSARTDATSIQNVKALIECESEQILTWLCDVRVRRPQQLRSHSLRLNDNWAM